ncbi:MAG: hypothetical protein RL514_2371 [Verrucomicrobiota bacterium]|jgi:hypothetical protein
MAANSPRLMNFYFSAAQIPELSALSTRQREQVDTLCLQPILLRFRVRLTKFAFLFPLMFTAFSVVPERWSFYQQLVALIAGMSIVYGADHLFDMVVVSLNRKSVAAFVLSHEKELQ